jgi:hypothetical protein
VVHIYRVLGDAFHANFQERVLKDGAHMLEVMLYSNFYAGILSLVVVFGKGL